MYLSIPRLARLDDPQVNLLCFLINGMNDALAQFSCEDSVTRFWNVTCHSQSLSPFRWLENVE